MSRVNILPILVKAKRLSILSAKYKWKENNMFYGEEWIRKVESNSCHKYDTIRHFEI